MDDLSWTTLQKMCLEAKAAGYLPPGTKCGGIKPTLIKLLEKASENRLEAQREAEWLSKIRHSTRKALDYQNILRHLAPYLSYDKLLLFCAYYPRNPLLREIRDPQGKIWTDRTWAELGEPPVDLPIGGPRYYHLWSTNRLLPWGNLVIGPTEIKKRCLRASALRIDGGLVVWAITPQGIEYFAENEMQPFRGHPETPLNEYSTDLLENPRNWKLILPGNFTYVEIAGLGHNNLRTYALNFFGDLYHYEWNNRIFQGALPSRLRVYKGIRYFRRSDLHQTHYMIKYNGDSIMVDGNRNSKILSIERPRLTRPGQRLSSLHFLKRLSKFEKFIIRSSTNDPWVVHGTDKIPDDPTIRGLVDDKLYYLPAEGEVQIIKKMTGTLPRESFTEDHAWILGLNGVLYQDNTVYERYSGDLPLSLLDLNFKLNDKPSYPPPRRLQSYGGLGIGSGVVW